MTSSDELGIPYMNTFLDDADIARNDLADYSRLMLSPDPSDSCLAIERAWGLDGLPPSVVTAVLYRVSQGGDLDWATIEETGLSE